MKGIIYLSEYYAGKAVESSHAIEQPDPVNVGTGVHAPREAAPYTSYIKHATEDKWAVIADEAVEAMLGKTAVELTEDWFQTLTIPS